MEICAYVIMAQCGELLLPFVLAHTNTFAVPGGLIHV